MKSIEINEAQFLKDFDRYTHLFKKAIFPIKGLPTSLFSDAFKYKSETSIESMLAEHFIDDEISSDNWKAYLSDQDNNFEAIQSEFISSQKLPSKSAPLRDAIVDLLKDIPTQNEFQHIIFNRCIESSKLLRDRVRSNFSADLRRLVLATTTPTWFKAKIIDNFDSDISLFKIETLIEYEETSKLIELALNGSDVEKLRSFLDLHAESICSFKIPTEYLSALAAQHEDLKSFTPRLHFELAKLRTFKASVKKLQKEKREQKNKQPSEVSATLTDDQSTEETL